MHWYSYVLFAGAVRALKENKISLLRLKSDHIGAAVVDLADAIAANTSLKSLNLEGYA